jgi:hypothetical protein
MHKKGESPWSNLWTPRSKIRFSCLATGIHYPNDTLSGVKWDDDFSDVRFTINPIYKRAAIEFSAQLSALKDTENFQAMAQAGGMCQLNFFRGPTGIELPDITALGKDGDKGHVTPDLEAGMDKLIKDSSSYRITCSRLEPNDKLTIRIWMLDANHRGHSPKGFRIEGGYDTSAIEGSRPIGFDELCNIKQ